MAVTPASIRAAVADAYAAAAALMEGVVHEPYTGQSGSGKPTYGAGVTRQAVVRHQPKVIRQSDGSETVATIALTFPSSFAVGSRDRFTVAGVAYLPQRLDYMPDPETGLPYFVEAWL